jgi:hypothetical protein
MYSKCFLIANNGINKKKFGAAVRNIPVRNFALHVPYTSGSTLCLGIPLVLVCNPCTSLRGKNYLFRHFCYHNGTVLYSSDALLLLLKMLTKKFREVNWHSGQVSDRAPPDIELIRSVVVVVVVVDVGGGGGIIIIIIIVMAYYRSLSIMRTVKTCPKQLLYNLHVIFL